MKTVRFQVLNVFAEERFGGNPLAVIEDGSSLSDDEMMNICRQFNLSETTFILPAQQGGAAKVRIFSPDGEMAFAGHPTLGTSFVVRELMNAGDAFSLELKVGLIPVSAEGDRWELRANRASSRAAPAREDIAAMLKVPVEAVLEGARWMSSGTEQLLVPIRGVSDLKAAWPDGDGLNRSGTNAAGRANVSCFVIEGDHVTSRYFWMNSGEVREDPGTGSACANLGAWMIERGEKGPKTFSVVQGEATGRINHLRLRLGADQRVFVGGRVIRLMRGEFLPST